MQGYDYLSPGIYFITIVTRPRRNLFWSDDYQSLEYPQLLSRFGNNLNEVISNIRTLDENVQVLNSIIMPDHIHLLVKIDGNEISISQVVRWIKSRASLLLRKEQPNLAIWQRSFYDHVIRNEQELELCNSYIEENPNNWRLGKEESDPF